MGGYFLEYNNFIPADPLKTPPHIAPVWYFTPYYSMLRATTEPMVMLVLAVGRGAVRAAAVLRAAAAAGATCAVLAVVGGGGRADGRRPAEGFDAEVLGRGA
ncbi:MAG: hypothetical protein MZW92_68900 [Comamonadaceae bacterium]|nr:hypothetical protein [Comamonadaceae bacterium]